MEDLISKAEEYLKARYKKPVHTVAAALETTSGKIYLGLNIDHFSGFVCAETSALAEAMNAGETSFSRLVAVRKEQDGTLGVANTCGKCRQILHDYAPKVKVAVVENNEVQVHSIEELLPYSFKRQRQKIQDALHDENANEIIG